MFPNLPCDLFGVDDFETEFLKSIDFAAEFDFGFKFSGAYKADYFAGDVDYDGMSVSCFCDNESALAGVPSSRKTHNPNRQYRICSVKKSCWYFNYLKLRETRELHYELYSSDQFGEFQN